MEIEVDANSLESRLAQIEEWKKYKDDAEYRAKVKAENEYWETAKKLKEYHERINNICVLANKLDSYKIPFPNIGGAKCKLVSLRPGPFSNYTCYFGKVIYDRYGSIKHYVLYKDDAFHYCCKNSSDYFVVPERIKPEIEILKEIYKEFPAFEEKFYKWFDEVTKID